MAQTHSLCCLAGALENPADWDNEIRQEQQSRSRTAAGLWTLKRAEKEFSWSPQPSWFGSQLSGGAVTEVVLESSITVQLGFPDALAVN